MKIIYLQILFLFTFFAGLSYSQSIDERYNQLGDLYVPKLATAPFPDSGRIDGHIYQNKKFLFKEHYDDSSVAIFIPKGFKQTSKTSFVIYFHGWNNNIDSASSQFKLIEQFVESNKNAILIFPEGPKNSPDSYGGKLEQNDGLKNLVADVAKYLMGKRKLGTAKIDKIILAGHSGAYRVISFCLIQGGITKHISDVILFDALYGQTEKYIHWIENYNGRFINIYTDNGGTKDESLNLMKDFDAWGIKYFKREEGEVKLNDLINNRLIFIHTDLAHNEVINVRKQFANYLKTSKIKAIGR